jgi:hypothetical protein
MIDAAVTSTSNGRPGGEKRTSKHATSTTAERVREPIAADRVYRLAEFQKATGLGPASVRQMKRRGFVVRRIGRIKFVIGSDFLTFLRSMPGAREGTT